MSRSDNFNRADTTSGLGTPSDGGSAWVALSGVWGISSNQAYESAGGPHSVAVLDSGTADVTVQMTLTAVGGNNAGVVARASDDNNYLLLAIYGGNTLEIYRRDAGSFVSLLAPVTSAYAAGDVFKLTVNGTSVTAYQNGVSKGTVTSAFNQTATKHGLRSHQSIAHRFDDFSVTDLGGGGAPAPTHFLTLTGVGG